MQSIYRKIEADAKNSSLIVHYDIFTDKNVNNKQSFKQIINISKPANKNIDIIKLARKIIQKCDTIPTLRLYELISALIELNRNGSLSSCSSYEFPISMHNLLLTTSKVQFDSLENYDDHNVSIDQLDYYIELLYEEMEDKIKGTLSILNLVSKPENLGSLSKNDTLLCALSRLLREDGKKSIDLATYIVCIFSHFSNYVDFQFAISNYKVGSTCLEFIYFEILREESWSKELNYKKSISENQLENLNAKYSYEKFLISYQNLVKKQNNFLKYALYILLNISEDLKLEYKIVNKGIIPVLVKLLERNCQDSLLIIVIYLKKLSVFVENKTKMKELNIIKSLTPLLFLDNQLLIYNCLKLLYNLMIDREMRLYSIRAGIVSKLVSFFTKGNYMSVIVSLFYLISCEPKYIAIFKNHPQLINILMEKVLQDVEYKDVLYNLLINLATNYTLAQIISQHSDCNEIIKIAFLEKNINLLRLLRNISCHNDNLSKLALIGYQHSLIELMLDTNNDLFLIDCATILINLSVVQTDWLKLYKQYSLFEFFLKLFASKQKSNIPAYRYILLFIAATSHQLEITSLLVEKNVINHLLDLLNDNQENDDIVLNTIYCFFVFVKVGKELRKQICHDTKLTDYLIDLMYDRNYQIKSLCTCTLDLISEEKSEFSDKIKLEKFNAYNNKWLRMIQSDRSVEESSHSLLEDMFIYPDLFLKMDILNDSSSENFSDENPIGDQQNVLQLSSQTKLE